MLKAMHCNNALVLNDRYFLVQKHGLYLVMVLAISTTCNRDMSTFRLTLLSHLIVICTACFYDGYY